MNNKKINLIVNIAEIVIGVILFSFVTFLIAKNHKPETIVIPPKAPYVMPEPDKQKPFIVPDAKPCYNDDGVEIPCKG